MNREDVRKGVFSNVKYDNPLEDYILHSVILSLSKDDILHYNSLMSDFMDRLPSKEQERIRKRMRSPEAYERLREKVKGPEDLENEMEKSEQLAELHYSMESEPQKKEAVKVQVEKDVAEQGIENVLDTEKMSPEQKKMIEQGKFTVAVSSHPATHEDALVVVPEGNVQEKIPVKTTFSETYTTQFIRR